MRVNTNIISWLKWLLTFPRCNSTFRKDAGVVTGVQGNHFTQRYCSSTHPDSRDSKPTSMAEIYVQLQNVVHLLASLTDIQSQD